MVHVVSLTHFYVQRYNQQLLTQLEQLKAVNSKKVSKVAPGTAYLASFHGDEAYHRVVVLDELACDKVKVHYMDFGNCLDLSIDELHPLPAELSHTPPLAIPCSLVGEVREYTEDILQRFSELVVDKLLSITVKVRLPLSLPLSPSLSISPFLHSLIDTYTVLYLNMLVHKRCHNCTHAHLTTAIRELMSAHPQYCLSRYSMKEWTLRQSCFRLQQRVTVYWKSTQPAAILTQQLQMRKK